MFCGIDIIEVTRIKDAILNTMKFKEEMFTLNEINSIEKCSEKLKYQRYAGRFAAKEAVFKAISHILIDNNLVTNLNEIEIINDKNYKNRPIINFLNEDISKLLSNYNIDISISHIESFACANCVISKK